MVRIVASYTTIPTRYDILYQSIRSLQSQTRPPDRIYLTIPRHSVRLNEDYPILPKIIEDQCTVLYIDTDYGPITKLYGALMSEHDPETLILSCDDDCLFQPTHIETLLNHYNNNPNSVIGSSGALIGAGVVFLSIHRGINELMLPNSFTSYNIPPEGRNVDILFGSSGILYPRKVFPIQEELYDKLLQYSLRHHSIFCNDNILIAGYLNKNNIPLKVFVDIPYVTILPQKDNLTNNLTDIPARLNAPLMRIKQYGFFPTTQPVTINETPAWRIFILILLILVLVIFGIYLWSIL
jgi:hypothetical protein